MIFGNSDFRFMFDLFGCYELVAFGFLAVWLHLNREVK